MKTRLSKFVLAALCLFAIVPTSAYAVFYFENHSEQYHIDTGVRVDDIRENYTFASASEELPTYDVYFFPSVLYLADDYGSNPEEDGYLLFDPENPEQLEVVGGSNVTNNYISKISQNNNYLPTSDNADETYSPNNIYSQTANALGREYGAPGDADVFTNDAGGRLPRNLSRYDRFGYWPSLSLEEGRYLPIKFENVQQLSSYLFNYYLEKPLSDMNDQENWYNFYFAAWTYRVNASGGTMGQDPINIDHDSDDPIEIQYFRNRDLYLTFDVADNLTKYADENNVVRLYPYFSNGVSYPYRDSNNNLHYNGDGFRDSVKIVGTTYQNQNPEHDWAFVFDPNSYGSPGETGDWIKYPGAQNNHVAILQNVYLDTSYDFTIQFRTYMPHNGNNWTRTGWINIYNFHNNNTLTNIVNTYGPGIYNLYLFVGNCGNNYEYDYSYDEDNLVDYNITNAYINNTFLAGKNLISLGRAWGDDPDDNSYAYWSRPTQLFIEKSINIKMLEGIDTSGDVPTETYNAYPLAYNFVRISDSGLEDGNRYVYIIRNVDLGDDQGKSFQIRLSQYYTNITINNPNNSVSYGGLTFEPYGNYFTLNSIQGESLFSVKEHYHIYDFILRQTGDTTYELYAYRHTNYFVKLFIDDVDHDSDNMAIHEGVDYLWMSTYASNQIIGLDDMCIDLNISLRDAIIQGVNQKGGSRQDYVVVDHVTRSVVAHFDESNNLVFNTRSVVKNYIFFIAHKTDLQIYYF